MGAGSFSETPGRDVGHLARLARGCALLELGGRARVWRGGRWCWARLPVEGVAEIGGRWYGGGWVVPASLCPRARGCGVKGAREDSEADDARAEIRARGRAAG